MAIGGIDLFSPTGIDIINWGANFGPLTLSGDWWRLVTCVFVHIGIIHLAFNMYALYMVGVYLEPMLGKTRYIVAYLCTGVFASLASIWWHSTPVPSAGASGAIFGMYGVFLALLSTNLIPKQIRNGLLQSIGIFIVYNLVYGLKSGVDNAAHIGGLLSGFVIGYLYFPGLKEKEAGKKKELMMGVVVALTFFSAFLYLENKKVTGDVRAKTKEDINSFTYKDADKFGMKYNDIIEMQNKALAPLNDKSLTDDQLLQKLTDISLPEWEKADSVVKELKAYNVSDKSKQKAEAMQDYIAMRKEQISLIRKLIAEKDETANAKLEELSNKIGQVIEKLDRL
jgi:rhomboid protease GluP